MKLSVNNSALSFNEVLELIIAVGHLKTIIIEGGTGQGKSALLRAIAKRLPEYFPCYMDMTIKDVGDLMYPKFKTIDGVDTFDFVPNQEFGFHLNQPVVIMADEMGKTVNRAVANAFNRLFYEHKMGTHTLPNGSIVFGTTNLAAEGFGDYISPYGGNRVIRVTMRNHTSEEWINNYALHNHIDPVMIAAAQDHPDLFASFTEYTDASQNVKIYDPRSPRKAFFTPRSGEAVSHILKTTRHLPQHVVEAAIVGSVGEAAARDIMATMEFTTGMPSWSEIIKDPLGCKIPEDAPALCMLVVQAVQHVTKETFNAWMDYSGRLPLEFQGLFAKTILSELNEKQAMAKQNTKLAKWASKNLFLFATQV